MEQQETDFINNLRNQDLAKVSDDTLAKQIERASKSIKSDKTYIEIARVARAIGFTGSVALVISGIATGAAPTFAFGVGLFVVNSISSRLSKSREKVLDGFDKIVTELKEENIFRTKLKTLAPHIKRGVDETAFKSDASSAVGFNDNAKPDPTQAIELNTPAATATVKQSVKR